jgi:hypothetical protein
MLLAANNDIGYSNGGVTVYEERKSNRYRLTVPVLFSWKDSHKSLQSSEGLTRDISMRGIFVLTADLPQEGACIELDAYLQTVGVRDKLVRLRAEGRVLRVEQRAAGRGFAAEVFFQPEPAETVAIPRSIQ